MSFKKQLVSLGLAGIFLSSGSLALAQMSGQAGTGPNPFVDCGIGAALFPNTHWAAVTSNVIWDIGTTAITSATLSPNTCSGKTVKTALFIRDSYPQLVEQAARGEGEHLKTALNLFGCSGAEKAVVAEIRSEMGAVVASDSYLKTNLEKAADMYKVMNRATSSHCSV